MQKIENESSEMRRELERVRRLSGEYIEYRQLMADIRAKVIRAEYDALIEQGFEEGLAWDAAIRLASDVDLK